MSISLLSLTVHPSITPTTICVSPSLPIESLLAIIRSSLQIDSNREVVGLWDRDKDIHFPLRVVGKVPEFFDSSTSGQTYIVLISPSEDDSNMQLTMSSSRVTDPENTLAVTGYLSPLLTSSPALRQLTSELNTTQGLGRVLRSFMGASEGGEIARGRFEQVSYNILILQGVEPPFLYSKNMIITISLTQL